MRPLADALTDPFADTAPPPVAPGLPSESASSYERFAGLAGRRLGEQRLAGSGWAVQQDASGRIATARLDGLGVLEEEQILADLLADRILAPHVVEPGLDVVGEVRLDTASPENQNSSTNWLIISNG